MNRNPDVDRWFDQADHPLDATMRRARDIILSADGRVTESIKWKTPTFAYRGNIASFNPSKRLLSIMFHRGAEIPGEHPRLEGDGTLVRTMRLPTWTSSRPAKSTWRPPSAPGATGRRTPPSQAESGLPHHLPPPLGGRPPLLQADDLVVPDTDRDMHLHPLPGPTLLMHHSGQAYAWLSRPGRGRSAGPRNTATVYGSVTAQAIGRSRWSWCAR
jgi:hypothetical protein